MKPRYAIMCETCCRLGRDRTVHLMGHPKARNCSEHRHAANKARDHVKHATKRRRDASARYWQDPERGRARSAAYAAQHREGKIAYLRQWRIDNREEYLEKQRARQRERARQRKEAAA